MTSIVSGIDYSQLFGFSANNDAASNIINIVEGQTTPSNSTAVSTGNPLTDLKLAQQNEAQAVAQEEKSPTVARDLAAFQSALKNAPDIKTALSNPAVLKVFLTANNLSSYIQMPAVAQKALLSNPSDSNSLVNKLGDQNLLNTARTFNFAANGLAALNNPTTIATLSHAYAEVLWRQSLDQATPGLSNALAFLTQASSIKTVDDILGDPVNRAVVLGALGIPQQVAFQDLTAQEQAVSSRLDVKKLQDPKFVTSLVDQYLLTQQQTSSTGTAPSLTALATQASGLLV